MTFFYVCVGVGVCHLSFYLIVSYMAFCREDFSLSMILSLFFVALVSLYTSGVALHHSIIDCFLSCLMIVSGYKRCGLLNPTVCHD